MKITSLKILSTSIHYKETKHIMNYDKEVDLALVIGSIHSSNTDKLYQKI